MPAFLRSKNMRGRVDTAAIPVAAGTGYRTLDIAGVLQYVENVPDLRRRVGFGEGHEAFDSARLKVDEVGDGNLNLVFIVEGPGGVIVIKQALPYVRCVGESWPLALERNHFEQSALSLERNWCPEHVPEVFLFDKRMYLFAMEFIPPPHLILRKYFVGGRKAEMIDDHLSTFLANTLYKSSALALKGSAFRLQVSAWSKNTGLCGLTEQVIFSDPYTTSPMNHWNTPLLDDYANGIRGDNELKVCIFALKAKFLGSAEALLHGDLHSGSIMVTDSSTLVIDPEFAFYGPMGFDSGLLLANMLFAYFCQPGHANSADYPGWVLAKTESLFDSFERKFLELWAADTVTSCGELHQASFPETSSGHCSELRAEYMRNLWKDTIGFAAAEMIRRIVGIAHVADLDSIADIEVRARCEKKVLVLARQMMVASAATCVLPESLRSPAALAALARKVGAEEPPIQWPH
ncbi:MTK1 [Symbiodinium microadriaticum]|nr:MTK1 [Symbiodinium microadriaticum]